MKGKRPQADTGPAADQAAAARLAPGARAADARRASVSALDKASLVDLVMELSQQQEALATTVHYLQAATARHAAAAPPEALVVHAFKDELEAAVEDARAAAEEETCGKYMPDYVTGTVMAVGYLVCKRVKPLAPGALQLAMLLAARDAFTCFTPTGAQLGRAGQRACIAAWAPRMAAAACLVEQHILRHQLAPGLTCTPGMHARPAGRRGRRR